MPCTDDKRSLDIRRLHRAGMPQQGNAFGWHWTRHGEKVASINIVVADDFVALSYRQSWRGGEWKDCLNTVRLDWTACNFGGKRPWWLCPTAGCGRRVAVLYSGNGLYACRHCFGLAYRSQRETDGDLAVRRANKVRDRLGWARGILNMPEGRPKGMHWTTYLHLLDEHTTHSTRALAGFERFLLAAGKQARN